MKRDPKAIQKLISGLDKKWRLTANKAVNRLYDLLGNGTPLSKALDILQKEYAEMFSLPYLKDALVEAAAYGYGITPGMLTNDAIWVMGKKLSESWSADGMKLSKKLHGTSAAMRDAIITTVRDQMAKNKTWHESAKALYDGYLDRREVLNVQDIPEYLKKVRRATDGNYRAIAENRRALENIARLGRNGAPNQALKTAYKQYFDAVQSGESAQISKAIKVAINEKSRYIAERITRTEMAKAWADGFWAKVLSDKDVVAVKYELSSRHPVFDACDLCESADMFNLGKGIFPKDEAPGIPLHPHCLCHFVEIYKGEIDLSKRKNQVEEAGKKWLEGLSDAKRKAVVGVGGSDAVSNGGDWRDYLRGWNGLSNPITRLQGQLFIVRKDEDSNILTREALIRGKYPSTQKAIDDILTNELKGVEFSHKIIYNNRIGTAGKTLIEESRIGICKVVSMQIGKQYKNTKEALIDTLIHEELEARIAVKSFRSDKYNKLHLASEDRRHEYINKVIERFFRIKGWNYDLG